MLELRGFQERRHVRELVNKHTAAIDVSFSDDAIDVVWEVFSGHPTYTINASQIAYTRACLDKLDQADSRIMAAACVQLLRQHDEYRKTYEP